MRASLVLLLVLLMLGGCYSRCGCGPRDCLPAAAQAPKAGLLEQAAAMRALDAWVQEAEGRNCRVTYTWSRDGGLCTVHLVDGDRAVVGEAPDMPTAASQALEKWKG